MGTTPVPEGPTPRLGLEQPPLPFLPAGMQGRHPYAVLGYDEATDTVHIWSPHGGTHRPRGAPGLHNGCATQGGRFTMPFADLVLIFRMVSYGSAGRTASPR